MSISLRLIAAAIIVAILTLTVLPFETDQYDLPPVPLADIGDEVSEYVEQNLLAAITAINTEIAGHEQCAAGQAQANLAENACRSLEYESQRLAYLRSNDAVAKAVYERLGEGSLFITKTGEWFNRHKFRSTPDRYKAPYIDSPYIFMPIDYATLSPTVRLYDSEFGTDKIEHFLQQGYKYYSIYREEISNKKDDKEAEQAAVRWGKHTENTYFGLLVAGVYSNGDLYANFAGMKFYQGLTHQIKIGDVTRPALLVLHEGRWMVDPKIDLRQGLIRPFINDRLNEAWNASVYAFNVYPTVKRVVTTKACPEWRKLYPDATASKVGDRSAALRQWNEGDYGWKKGSRMVPIALCFEDPTPSTP
jgi:hypothetical protein